MLSTTTKEKIKSENLQLFKMMILSMSSTKDFNVKTLIRKIRPFCRTTFLNNRILSIRLKYSQSTILLILHQNGNIIDSVTITYTSKFPTIVENHLLHVSNNRELLEKIVINHQYFD